MNYKVEPHKSSILDADANLIALSVYLIPLLGNFMSLGLISWVLPLVYLFLEKNSPLVYFHAVQSLVMQIAVALFNGIVMVFGLMSAGTNLLLGFNIFSAMGTVGLIGLLSAAVSLVVMILELIGLIKAYEWEIYYLPFFGDITKKFTDKYN